MRLVLISKLTPFVLQGRLNTAGIAGRVTLFEKGPYSLVKLDPPHESVEKTIKYLEKSLLDVKVTTEDKIRELRRGIRIPEYYNYTVRAKRGV